MATKMLDQVPDANSLEVLATDLVASMTAQAAERRSLIEDMKRSVEKGRQQIEALGLN